MEILSVVTSYMFLLGEEKVSAKEFAIKIKEHYSLENTHNMFVYQYLLNLDDFWGKKITFNNTTITID
jgi:hypothetical protein